MEGLMKMRNELCSSLVFSQITLRDSWCIFYTMVVVVAQLLKNSKKMGNGHQIWTVWTFVFRALLRRRVLTLVLL